MIATNREIITGGVALSLSLLARATARPQRTVRVEPAPAYDSLVAMTRPHEWWLERENPDDLADRQLYAGAVWRNLAPFSLALEVRYLFYTTAGDLQGACTASSETMRPGELSWARCKADGGDIRARPFRRADFQVVAKIQDARRERAERELPVVVETQRFTERDGEVSVTAQLRSTATVNGFVRFLLYAKDSTLVGACSGYRPGRALPQGGVIRADNPNCAHVPSHIGVDHMTVRLLGAPE